MVSGLWGRGHLVKLERTAPGTLRDSATGYASGLLNVKFRERRPPSTSVPARGLHRRLRVSPPAPRTVSWVPGESGPHVPRVTLPSAALAQWWLRRPLGAAPVRPLASHGLVWRIAFPLGLRRRPHRRRESRW